MSIQASGTIQASGVHLPGFAGPLYVQVAGILREKICASEWTSRAPLPNEVSLARDIGVSIGTIRKALEMLETERLIQRRQGRGTFVVDTSDETELERFSNIFLAAKKLRADPPAWQFATGVATAEECKILKLPASAPVYRLDATWTSGPLVATVETITVSQVRFPRLQEHVAGAGQFLFPLYRRHYQEVISRVTEAVTCANADAAVCAKLNVRKDQAVLCVDRVAFAMSGGPVEWSRRTMHLSQATYAITMS